MERGNASYRGCLLGLAVGDAMGYAVDRKSWEEICADYGPNGLLGYDLANGTADVTSHTQLAAFVCNGLLLGAFRSTPEQYDRYARLAVREWAKSQQFRTAAEKTACWVAQVPALRRRHCMDTRMLDALNRETLGTMEKPVFRSTTPCALTEAVGIALAYEPEKMTMRQLGTLCAQTAALTHGEPSAFLPGVFVSLAVALILQSPGKPLPEQFEAAMALLDAQFGETYPQCAELCARLRRALSLTKDAELTPLAAMTLLQCTDAQSCLDGAVYASAIHPSNFDEAMIVSVNHSGRSAAVGALTGAILGARLGASALPEFYLESLEVAGALSELTEDLALRGQVGRIFDDSWDQKYVQGLPV